MWEKQALPNQHVRSYPTQSKKLSASQGFKHCLKCGGENGGFNRTSFSACCANRLLEYDYITVLVHVSTFQYKLVQVSILVSTSQCKLEQVNTSQYKLVQVCSSKYILVQVSTFQYKLVQVSTSQYTLVQVSTSQYISVHVTMLVVSAIVQYQQQLLQC